MDNVVSNNMQNKTFIANISARINDLLQKTGFHLQKGDAYKVAQVYLTGNPGPEIEIEKLIQIAETLGIKKVANFDFKRKLSAEITFKARLPEIPERAIQEAGDLAAQKISEPNFLDPVLQKIIDIAVDEERYKTVVNKTPWDISLSAEPTYQPYNLLSYHTIGEFLEEPNGNTRATYVSGSGLTVETHGDDIWRYLSDLICGEIKNAIKDLYQRWHEEEKWEDFFKELQFEWEDAVYEYLDEKCMCEPVLLGELSDLSFREMVMRFRPDTLPRLRDDQEQKVRIEKRIPEFKEKANELISGFEKADHFVDKAVAGTLALALDADGWASLFCWFDTEDARLLFPRQIHREWVHRIRNCLDRASLCDISFTTPFVSLWRYLTMLWLKDNRSWYVTVTTNRTIPFSQNCASFSSDNWEYFLAWSFKQSDQPVAVVLRRFEHLFDKETGLPWKSVGGLFIANCKVNILSAEEIRIASTTDPGTRRILPLEPFVRYVDTHKLLAGWEGLA